MRSLFNGEITAKLLAGAQRGFDDARVRKRDVEIFEVPGSFELPLAALWLAKSGKYDAIVCLGCVVRGETTHYEYVAGEAARGIAQVSLVTGVPVIFGVLTTENTQQALSRAADVARVPSAHSASQKSSNKGYEAARSALQMTALRRSIRPRR